MVVEQESSFFRGGLDTVVAHKLTDISSLTGQVCSLVLKHKR